MVTLKQAMLTLLEDMELSEEEVRSIDKSLQSEKAVQEFFQLLMSHTVDRDRLTKAARATGMAFNNR